MGFNIYDNTREFERQLCDYTGAPFALAIDNCCNALFLCLRWLSVKAALDGEEIQKEITIPSHTYIGVPYAIRAAGFTPIPKPSPPTLKGEYQLHPLPVWDSALRFTSGMYRPGQMQCLSFTGPYKHLKLGKAGAIILDSEPAYNWIKKARFSGRSECSYHEDTFTMSEGYNYYLAPQIATMGAHLMQGVPTHNQDLTLPYPDWSQHPAYAYTTTI